MPNTYPSPVNPLAVIYTAGMVAGTIGQWLNKENMQQLDPEFIKSLMNLAILNVAETISGAGGDDYGRTALLSDSSSSVTSAIGTDAAWNESANTVTKTAHGLTANNAGQLIALWSAAPSAMIAQIVSITDADNFVITPCNTSYTGPYSYAVFTALPGSPLNISGYPILNIIKIVDSINYECIEVGSKNFDNLYRFPEKQNKTYWYKNGQYLYFYIGANVASVGTRTMSYNSYPQRVMNDNDFLDIKDAYVPLVIDFTKSYCIEHLGGLASGDLTASIAAKVAAVRQNILLRQQLVAKQSENNQ